MEYYSSIKINEILPFVTTQMDWESEKNTVWCHLYEESKTSEYNKNETDLQRTN